jgi:hypothetical protein
VNDLKILNFLFVFFLTPNLANADADPSPVDITDVQQKNSQWGLAGGVGWITDYPGAAQGRMRYLVMPAFHSKYITVDRQDGARAHLVNERRIKFSVSFSFLLPTSAQDIPVRQGMPDLDLILQLGPELQIYFLRSNTFNVYLRLPVRFIVATDFKSDFEYLQWTFAPSLRTEYNFGSKYGKLGTRLEFDFASARYQSYFYQVEARYATADRPTYHAKMGIMEYIVGLQYSYDHLLPVTFSASANIYLMRDAVNRNSPLHLRNEGYSFLGLMVYYF